MELLIERVDFAQPLQDPLSVTLSSNSLRAKISGEERTDEIIKVTSFPVQKDLTGQAQALIAYPIESIIWKQGTGGKNPRATLCVKMKEGDELSDIGINGTQLSFYPEPEAKPKKLFLDPLPGQPVEILWIEQVTKGHQRLVTTRATFTI